MASQPIGRLVRALEDPDGHSSLDELRKKLSSTGQTLKVSYEALGIKGKTFLVYAGDAPREQGTCFVVKFNPMGRKDPYLDDVYKEFRILTKLKSLHIAPAPLFCSSDAEEEIIGTAFIAMTWVEGRIFRTVGEIPEGSVVEVYQVAMKKLVEVHGRVLGDRELAAMHDNTQSYWQEVVDVAVADYKSTVGWWRWWLWPDPEGHIFSRISRGRKPTNTKRIGLVHGNLDIGNFVFNTEMTEVRAILNWKYEKNGDGLMDIASLLLAFLDIGRVSDQRTIYPATDQEVRQAAATYRKHAVNGLSPEELEFAKAVCCLKLICIVKRGAYDNFAGHELSRFPEIADNPDMVTNLLYRQAKQSYETFSQ